MQYQKNELFQGYEIKNWEFSPRLYKLFGAAAVLNVLLLFGVVQANIFTTRGCDSPLVGSFCTVIDTLYLGKTVLDSNDGFISEDYEKTKLEDAEITYIDVSNINNQPLNYPEGYFALANPESMMTQIPSPDMNGNFPMSSPNFNGFPVNPTTINPTIATPNPTTANPLAQAPVTPTPNPDAVTGKIDDDLFDFEKIPVNRENPVPPPPPGAIARNRPPRGRKRGTNSVIKPPRPEKTPEVKKPEEQPPLDTEAIAGVRINRKVFEDFGDLVNSSVEKKEVDLTKPFLVVMDGVINSEGKLDSQKSKFVREEGDEKMREIAKQAIEAVGDSGFLGHLKNVEIEKLKFTITQDDKQINIIVVSDQKTSEKAKTTASSLNTIIGGLKIADQTGMTKLDDNSRVLIENSKITSDGKNFTLNFMLPKETAQNIISETLKKRAIKKADEEKNGKPNSTATVNSNQKTAR